MNKPRLLLVWHEAGNHLYQDRFKRLQQYFEVEALGPTKFQDSIYSLSQIDTTVKLFDAFLTSHWLSFFSFKLLKEIVKSDAEVLYVHEEPHSVMAFLCALLKGKKRMIIESSVINRKGNFSGLNPFESFVYHQVEKVFPKNHEVGEVLLARGLAVHKLDQPIGNGVDVNSFYVVEKAEARKKLSEKHPEMAQFYNDGQSKLIVGYAGRIWQPKGLEVFCKLLSDESLAIQACGPIVDADLYKKLEDSGVQLLPKLNQDELVLFYSALDVFILPSLETSFWREQFGRVCLEAIYCGTPAIGSNVGGIPSVIGVNNTFTPGSIDEIKNMLDELKEESIREEMLVEQKSYAKSNFSWDAIAEEIHRRLIIQ